MNGCNPTALSPKQLDVGLPKLDNVHAVAGSTYVAFEWKSMEKDNVDAINIYRTHANTYVNSATKELVNVGMVHSPFASHYVDTGLRQNSTYTYTFTTIRGDRESAHGKILRVKTLAPFPAITFFQAFQKGVTNIKLIWRPHPDQRVKMYKIERSVNGEQWKWVDTVKHRMMAEFIDNFAAPGNAYSYRVTAVGFDDSISKPSKAITIYMK
jgi:fibronectin type 3 domain-containing protein